MFGKRIYLFKILGFAVSIDTSWFVIAAIITWSLAQGIFPERFEKLSIQTYWLMGAAGALGLFGSIIFHELCHSIVARQYGMPMKGITLFIFGGVAEMSDEPPSPKAEFMMAIAGPISSVALGIMLYFVWKAGNWGGWPVPVNGVVRYLSWLNLMLAGFNMVPAFPLDGGRVLRSILWAVKKNLRWATRIASQLGSWFGMFMIAVGVLSAFAGDLWSGVWWFLLGMFLRRASQMSYQQLVIRKGLEGELVRHFMRTELITVPSSILLSELVENYFYRYHFRIFPVVQDGALVGCITSQQVKEVPREQWNQLTVAQVAAPCSPQTTISPNADAMQVLALMNQTGNSRLMVIENGSLVGIITLKDMLKFLSLKIDLEKE
jgi:Zn-dependent protease